MADMLDSEYWDGTVMCPRKGLCHISHRRCLTMYDEQRCDGCENKSVILADIERQRLAEAKSKAECKALSNQKPRSARRGRPKKDPSK